MPRDRDPKGQGKGGQRIDEGLGGGPVGSSSGYSGRPADSSNMNDNRSQNQRQNYQTPSKQVNMGQFPNNQGNWNNNMPGNNRNNRRNQGITLAKLIRIAFFVIVAIIVFRSCTANFYTEETVTQDTSFTQAPYQPQSTPQPQQNSVQQTTAQDSYTHPYGINDINAATTSSGWTNGSNVNSLSTSVSGGARSKFYQPSKNGTVNIILYMIGTDLESEYKMGTSDLQEIVNGLRNVPNNVNIFVYGGGCKNWHNNKFSNRTNYVYKLSQGGRFELLYDDGNKIMTQKSTLSDYLKYINKNYQTTNSSDRNILIFWDHGGGSVSGYGYDERHKGAGSMPIDDIESAVKDSGMKFDFIGFDACLMGTTETAYALSDYADYLIASEESEPGIGWYYTNWINNICNNTTVSTLELGKEIVDDFVNTCARQCAGQDTTLSVVDLAEFDALMPQALVLFSDSTTSLIEQDYNTVSRARGASKEFASDSRIDQVDLASLASRLGTEEGKQLVDTIKQVVKYNKTSYTVSDAYGLSIYFPYRRLGILDDAVETYSSIGLTDNYSRCIQTYASVAGTSQQSSYGWGSPYGSLSGNNYDNSSYYSTGSEELIFDILSQMLYGRNLNLDVNKTARYIANNQFDATKLTWTKNSDGVYTISLPKDQWQLITEVEQNLFYNDGKGYVDLGLDITNDCFTTDGQLVGEYYGYWLGIDGWLCAYYRMNEIVDENGNTIITGRVPCYFNGNRANLIVQHTNNKGEIIGVSYNYTDDGQMISGKVAPVAAKGETDNISSDFTTDITPVSGFKKDDKIMLIADCYDYNNNYQDNYAISETMTWGDGLTVNDVSVPDISKANVTYRLTDIYQKTYWTPVLK